jgi:di/tricarboxylate transporter
MTGEIALVLGIVAAATVLFVSERLRPDLVAILVLLAVVLTGLLTPQEAFASIGNPAVVTVGATFVISAALFQTGVAHALGDRIARVAGQSEARLLVGVMMAAALISSVMNNVAAAAVLLPVVSGLARRAKIPPSRLLIPLAFGSLGGGMLLLIGTPANLLVDAALIERDLPPLNMLSLTPVGVLLTVLSVAYMATAGRRLLPTRPSSEPFSRYHEHELSETYQLEERLFRVCIPRGSRLIGQTLAESNLRDLWNLNVISVERHDIETLDPPPDTIVHEGDILLLEGRLDEFVQRDVEPYLEVLPRRHWTDADLESASIGLAEAVVAPRSGFAGKTLREVHFREKYALSVVGIWRGNRPIRTGLGEIPLQVGDALLIQGPREKFRVLGRESDLLMLNGSAGILALRPSRAPLAVGAVGVMLITVLAGWLDLATGAVLAGTLMILAGALSMEEAQHAIDLKAIFIIAAMLPLGRAMETTGTASFLANQIVAVFGTLGPVGVLAGITLFAGLSVQIISNSATAVLVAPIALTAARDLGANPHTFAIAIALAVSAAFLTPISHQSNLLVMAAGGYRFTDYTKVGIGVWALTLVGILVLVPVLVPLFP